MSPVTTRADRVLTSGRALAFIGRYWQEHGFAPTLAEIRAALELKTQSTASYHVDRLVVAGLVAREEGSPRTIRPTAEGWRRLGVEKCVLCGSEVKS